ncbi:MAG TPA: hypothetical protein VFB79_09900, partial [Candidatus Angelobacter sp.]|nr:hypothetical protein [Candidatus Angelobacter sp.]
PLLQISSDERARVSRVAEQFSEEDLARFLQIMLRTFDELGYRQEQRFHLELGVLKLVHAQRILPLEQILSQTGSEQPRTAETIKAATPMRPAAPISAGAPALGAAAPKQSFVSPFEADRARKRSFDPEMSTAAAAAPAPVPEQPTAQQPVIQSQNGTAATTVAVAEPEGTGDPATILGHVITAIENTPGGDNLAATLSEGSAIIQGNELIVTVDRPASVLPFIISPAQKQVANAAASAIAGRTLKLTLASGAKSHTNGAAPVAAARPRNGASARNRAADDPIVQRMREKFGAEIRTVIDHREKN